MPKRNYEKELYYQVEITDWYAHTRFNDYAFLNISRDGPYDEHYYMALTGKLASSPTKKVKKGQKAEIAIHPGEFSRYYEPDDGYPPIGDMEILNCLLENGKERIFMFRIALPEKSFTHIRAALTHQPKAKISMTGTDLSYRKGEVYSFSFDSRTDRE